MNPPAINGQRVHETTPCRAKPIALPGGCSGYDCAIPIWLAILPADGPECALADLCRLSSF
jgi:hypothetical protein